MVIHNGKERKPKHIISDFYYWQSSYEGCIDYEYVIRADVYDRLRGWFMRDSSGLKLYYKSERKALHALRKAMQPTWCEWFWSFFSRN